MPGWLEAVIYFLSAVVLLRLAGKRTFSQLTIGEVIIMIGLGTVLVHPLKSENSWLTAYHGALIVLGVLILSYSQIYFPRLKKWIIGEPMVLISNGQIISSNLKKARMTVDELKARLRTQKVNDLSKVKTATLEISGQLGLELNDEHSYATKSDIEQLKQAITAISIQLNTNPMFYSPPSDPKDNLFNQAERVEDQDPLQ